MDNNWTSTTDNEHSNDNVTVRLPLHLGTRHSGFRKQRLYSFPSRVSPFILMREVQFLQWMLPRPWWSHCEKRIEKNKADCLKVAWVAWCEWWKRCKWWKKMRVMKKDASDKKDASNEKRCKGWKKMRVMKKDAIDEKDVMKKDASDEKRCAWWKRCK